MNFLDRYHAKTFFIITFALSWVSWGMAIYASWQPSIQHLLLPLVLFGLSAPMVVALLLIIGSLKNETIHDFFRRLSPNLIKISYIPAILLLFPAQIVITILLSIIFGQTMSEIFAVRSDQALHGIDILASLFVISLVGPFEEIGWRGYAIDKLISKFNLIVSSLILGSIWGLWHVPLFFIKNGAFQDILRLGMINTTLYFVDLIALTVIINWLYYKNNRSILAVILFHSIYDMCFSLIRINPITWQLLSAVIISTALCVIYNNKKLFFDTVKII